MCTMVVTTTPSILKPYANGSKTWYCDHKGPTCNRGSGLYHGTRWSNRGAGGSYDLCNNCAHYYQKKKEDPLAHTLFVVPKIVCNPHPPADNP